jgi:hypothetical protein
MHHAHDLLLQAQYTWLDTVYRCVMMMVMTTYTYPHLQDIQHAVCMGQQAGRQQAAARHCSDMETRAAVSLTDNHNVETSTLEDFAVLVQ